MTPRRRMPGFPRLRDDPETRKAVNAINRAAADFFRVIEQAIGHAAPDAANRARQQARLEIDRAAHWAVVGLLEAGAARSPHDADETRDDG